MKHAAKGIVRSILASIGLVGAFCSSASAATQCVYNKGAYVLNVQWYTPDQLIVDMDRSRDLRVTLERVDTSVAGKAVNQSLKIKEGGELAISEIDGIPVTTHEMPALQGRCITWEEPLTAVMSAVGAAVAAKFAKVTLGTLVTVAGTIATVGACTAGAVTCPAVAAGTVYWASTAIGQLPVPADDIFYVGTPSTTHYVDTWGTIFEPVFGDGGPVPREDE